MLLENSICQTYNERVGECFGVKIRRALSESLDNIFQYLFPFRQENLGKYLSSIWTFLFILRFIFLMWMYGEEYLIDLSFQFGILFHSSWFSIESPGVGGNTRHIYAADWVSEFQYIFSYTKTQLTGPPISWYYRLLHTRHLVKISQFSLPKMLFYLFWSRMESFIFPAARPG